MLLRQQQCTNRGGPDVSNSQLYDFGRGPKQESQLIEIAVLRNNCEMVHSRKLAYLCIRRSFQAVFAYVASTWKCFAKYLTQSSRQVCIKQQHLAKTSGLRGQQDDVLCLPQKQGRRGYSLT